MKIAFILDEEWDSALTHYTYGVYRALSNEHDVVLLCLEGGYTDRKYADNKIYIDKLRNKNPLKGVRGLKSLARAFKVLKPDVVVTILGDAAFFSCLLKKRFGFKLIRIFGEDKDLRTPGECMDRLLLPADFLKKRVNVKKVGGIDVVKGFVDTDKFVFSKDGRKRIRRLYGIPDNVLLFGSVGRLDKVKGYPLLIRAFAEMEHESRLMIVGQKKGENVETLIDAAEQENLKGRVIIIDDRRKDIVDIMSAFDVGVISSIGSETIARVMFEFMSVGLPIVTTDAGMLKEIADKSFCVTAKAGSEASLADAMKAISKQDIKTMGINASKLAQQYSFPSFQQKILSFFEAV